MEVSEPHNQQTSIHPRLKKLLFNFLFFIITTIFSLHTSAQSICVANIDTTGKTEFCLSAGPITFSNAIASGENIEWLSSGDGTFNDALSTNPTYTPGANDIANGYVFIYLDVYKDDPVDPCSALPLVTLHLGTMHAIATPAAQTICSGSPITRILLSSGLSGINYNWTRNNTASITGIAASGSSPTDIRGTLTNTTTAPVTVTFTITPTASTCSGTPITATVLVNPRPAAVATPASQTICSGATITPVALSSAVSGTTYSWTRNNTASVTGIAASGSGNITGALTNTTASPVTVTFTITPTANGCAGTPITATVLVNPTPNVVVATPSLQTICSGATITAITSSGGGGGTTYSWTRNNTASVTGIAASGSGNITGALTNTTTAPVYVTFTITASSGGCTNRAAVLVNPRPNAIATPSSQTICSGATITPIALSGGVSGTIYNWTRNNTASVTDIAASGSGSITGALTNTTASPVTVTFTITPIANGCTGTPITATVLVNPVPNVAVAAPSSQTICSGATITPIALSGGGVSGTVYNWTRNNTVSVTGIAASGSGNISGALTNTTTAPVSVTFTITPTANGCTGTPITATVLINPAPNVIRTPASQAVCSGATITTITLSGSVSGTTYNWTRDNTASVTGIAASGSGNISGALTNTTAAPVTVTFTITPTANGCTGTPATATVLVNPIPNAVRTPASQTVCSGAIITTIALSGSVSGTTYNWTRDNTGSVTGIAASGAGNISGALTNTTAAPVTVTFTITPTANSCSGSPVTATATVNPRPTSLITGNQTLCAGQSLSNISIALTGTAPWSFTYFDGTTPVTVTGNTGNPYTFVPPALPKVYTVTSLNDANCTAQAGDRTGSATLSQLSYNITASAGANGSISPNGTTSVNCGTSQVYTITPNAGFNIQDVLVDGISQGALATYTFSNVTAAHTISAIFSSGAFTITANAGANGTITPSGAVAVTSGANQTFSIAANSCYQIADVLVDGISQGVITTYTFTNVTATHTISATFSPLNYIITASAGANGTITPNGATNVNCGQNQTFTIAANSCYQIADVLVDGVSQGAITTYTFTNVTATHTISAMFSQLSYTITASAGVNGTITPNGATSVNCGASQVYTITPNAGFNVQDVLVDGVSQGAVATYTFTNVTATHNISAIFSSGAFTISASAGANGTITPAGAVAVTSGANQTFSIAANSCYQIADVLVDGVSQGAITTYTFTNVTATHTINATFSQLSYSITASAGANGSISPNDVTSVNCGASQVYTITPNAGFNVQDVLVDGVSQGAVATYTFTNVTATHNISAIFSSGAFTISASAGANGTITPAGAVAVTSGANQTFSIAANSCYQIADVLVDGVSQGAITTYTFTNVTATHTISATFSQVSYLITATAGANGAITPSGATNVNCGASQTYNITANAGFAVQSVLVDGVSQGVVPNYTFTNVTATHTISATFTAVSGCTAPTLSTSLANVLCRNASTGSINLTTSGGTAPFTYTWTGPNGFTATTEDIAGLAAGSYSVIVTASGGCSATTTVSITQPAAALTASATAAAMSCSGLTTTLTVTAAGGTGARQYSLNGGAFLAGNTFTVDAAGSPYIVTVRDANLCTATTNSVTVAPAPTTVPATPAGIDGPTYGLCGGGTFTYTVQPVAGATSYFWTGPSGFTIVSGQLTTQVQIAVPATFTGSTGIWATARNACGPSAGYRLAVNTVLSYPGSSISGPATVSPGQTNVQYSLPFTAGATFAWLVPSGSTVASGQGTNSITVNFGTSSGNVSADITNACGTGPRVSKAVTVAASKPANTSQIFTTKTAPVNQILTTTYFSVYPNPAQSNATIVFSSQKKGSKFEVVISNTIGETLLTNSGVTIAGKNMMQFDLSNFINGMYLVRLITEENIQTQKLLKER